MIKLLIRSSDGRRRQSNARPRMTVLENTISPIQSIQSNLRPAFLSL